MNWVQLAFGAISLAREIIKLMREQSETKKETFQKITEFKHAAKKARLEGDTNELESMFKSILSQSTSDKSVK
jgi:hypothetical protein